MRSRVTVGNAHPGGPLRALHGLNNGPIAYGGLIDVTELYLSAAIPSVRVHDPNWPHSREIDIHTIFPDFDRDPRDPTSYDFRQSDDYIRAIERTGASIVYRLGESIEHTKAKYFVHPPGDNEKWAEICLGIIRHYNSGWADGFHLGIRHWEVWNEPDNPDAGVMWSGTFEDYLDLYAVVARAIKREFPDVLVGGPACTMVRPDEPRQFLERCRRDQLPMDFFSWHTYTGDVQAIVLNAERVRQWLVDFGFSKAEIHLNEWNYEPPSFGEDLPFAMAARRKYEKLKGPEGAAFAAGVLCALQDTAVTVANYYDGQPLAWYCGLFDDYGNALPTYEVFQNFAHILSFPTRLTVDLSEASPGLHAIAAQDGDEVETWLVNPGDEALELALRGLGRISEIRTVSSVNRRRAAVTTDGEGETASVALPPHSVSIVRSERTTRRPEQDGK